MLNNAKIIAQEEQRQPIFTDPSGRLLIDLAGLSELDDIGAMRLIKGLTIYQRFRLIHLICHVTD